ncbi:MAG: hypothetical protein ACXADO_12935 [Candidatus Thorarchaeota archaeon]|jgi:uncharacterized membrane protein (DUF2068 family)
MARTPMGVTVLAVLNLLIGILFLVGSLVILGPLTDWIVGPFLLSIGGSATLLGILYIIIGLGLLTLQSWAWWLDMVFAIINVVIALLGFPNISWIALVLNLIILLYLNQRSIRRKFGV